MMDIKWREGSSFPSHAIPEPGDIHSNGGLGEREQTKENICVVSLWNSLPQDVGMTSGLDAFKKGESPLQVTSHDGDVSSPGFEGRDRQRPDAGKEGYQETA